MAGVVLLALFVAVERHAQESILAMRLFKNRVFGVSLDQLVRRRLVATDPGGDAITLTEDGRSGIERLCAAREDDLRELLDGWPPEQDPELDERLRSLAPDCINADAARLRRDERLRSAA